MIIYFSRIFHKDARGDAESKETRFSFDSHKVLYFQKKKEGRVVGFT